MNNSFSLEQIAKTGYLNGDLIMRQNKLDILAKFMEIKSLNPKLKRSEVARELKILSSFLQRYRREINMHSPYRLSSSNTNTRKQKISNHTEHDLKMTSNDVKKTWKENDKTVSKKVKTKNNWRGGNPNDDNPTQGNFVFEKTFPSQ